MGSNLRFRILVALMATLAGTALVAGSTGARASDEHGHAAAEHGHAAATAAPAAQVATHEVAKEAPRGEGCSMGDAVWAKGRAPASTRRSIFAPLGDAWDSIQDKVDDLRHASEEVQRLSLENANLRLQLESQEFECQSRLSQKRTEAYGKRLGQDTGSPLGRTLASIEYRPPTHLLPGQLYTLALGYLKGKEEEKAAVILSFLSNLEDEAEYRTAKNLLLAGVAWFRVENYDTADQFFARVLDGKQTPVNAQYHAQARVWRGLVSQKKGKHDQAQDFLKDLIAHHPHSTEAKWVNPGSREAERVPASE